MSWQKTGNRWWWRYNDGSYPKRQWLKISGVWYYFDRDGWMVTGWLRDNNKWYYLNADGAMVTGWQLIGNHYYYFDKSGVMLTGMRTINGKKYYLDNNGIMLTGWQKVDSKWYWFDIETGAAAKGWQIIAPNGYYYFNSKNVMVEGWLNLNGKYYYLLPKSGQMVTGWREIERKWYYFNDSGVMQKGWQLIGKNRQGLVVNKKRYWFDSSGAMATGLKRIDGTWYLFADSGALKQNVSKTAGVKPTNLKIDRKGKTYTATWKLPEAATKEGSTYIYSSQTATWDVLNSGALISKTVGLGYRETTNEINLGGFTATQPKGAAVNRQSFYPLTNRKVDGLHLTVFGNPLYAARNWQTLTYSYTLPRKPAVAWSYDTENGRVTVTITTDAGEDNAERYDTMYMVEVKTKDGATQQLVGWTASTSTKITRTFDTSPYVSQLAQGKTVTFTARAYARGFKGDNPAKDKAVTASRTIAIPNAATIKSVTASSKADTGRITVNVAVGANTDSVQLQRRHGEDGSWQDVEGATDNGSCKALYDSVGLAELVQGEYLYYRVVSTKDNYTTTGMPFKATALYTAVPTTPSPRIGIVSLAMDEDGTGAKMVVGWTESTAGTGTEVTWSQDFNAWESTEEPESYTFTWEDATRQSSSWQHTGTLYIKGLEQGKTYYFKARRTYEDDVFSDYASRSAITPADVMAEGVSLTAPAYVVRGEPITAYWSYDGETPQKSYAIHPEGNPKVSLASGRNSMATANIPKERYGNASSVSFYVSISTGGEQTDSNVVTVEIVDIPTCDVAVADTLTVQPLSFEAYTNRTGSNLSYKVVAEGIVADYPDKTRRQLNGDTVSVGSETPSWSRVTWSSTLKYSNLTAKIAEIEEELEGIDPSDERYEELENELADVQAEQASLTGYIYKAVITTGKADFIDTGAYHIEASIADQRTGLASAAQTEPFTVDWAHQAPTPPDSMEIEVDYDERSVTIYLEAAEEEAAGDTYDLYRGTRSGFDLIKESLPTTAIVTDRYPAFGEQQFYRVVYRTADGDIAWTDVVYTLEVDAMRFDWADGSSESIHNLNFSDNYAKDFERRAHLDGKGGGYWNGTVERSGSYATTAIKGIESTNLEALGRHAGAVFCRTPEGYAFQCNVNVSRSNQQTSMLEEYSLAITEVDLTADFMPTDDDVQVS